MARPGPRACAWPDPAALGPLGTGIEIAVPDLPAGLSLTDAAVVGGNLELTAGGRDVDLSTAL